MKDIGIHIALFTVVGIAIVALSSAYAEPDDRAALQSLPRRIAWFFCGCALVAAILLVLEHTVASVS